MESLKNIVVLKNLPSNVVDEAFLILKPNKKLEYTPKKEQTTNSVPSKDYIIKEAEMVIASYLNRNDNSGKIELENLKKKNKKLKLTSIILSVVIVFGAIINIFS